MTHGAGTRDYDVVVIGGGVNGMIAAGLLAQHGRRVGLFEARQTLGGLAASEPIAPGFQSAGLVPDTRLFSATAARLLRLAGFGLRFADEIAPVFTPQMRGRGLLLDHDPDRAASEIAGHAIADVPKYVALRALLAAYRPIFERLALTPPPDLANLGLAALTPYAGLLASVRGKGARAMAEFMRALPMCSADWLNEWFESPLLKASLALPASRGTLLAPWSAGTNLNLLLGESLASPPIVGGPPALVQALSDALRMLDVDVHTSAPVEQIVISRGAVAGVRTRDGREVASPCVVAGCDARTALLGLVAPEWLSASETNRVSNFRTNGATTVIHLALRGDLRFACRPELAVRTARLAEHVDEIERAFDASKYGRFTSTPVLEVFVPSADGPDLAPPGGSVVTLLAQFAPMSLRGGWTDAARREFADAAIHALARYAPDLPDQIVERVVHTPADLERELGLSGGHLDHGEHALDQWLLRPTPDAARGRTTIPGLYLCSGSIHPGGYRHGDPGLAGAAAVLSCPVSAL